MSSTTQPAHPTPPNSDYAVGWICAVPIEMAAAKGTADETHGNPQMPPQQTDQNTYLLYVPTALDREQAAKDILSWGTTNNVVDKKPKSVGKPSATPHKRGRKPVADNTDIAEHGTPTKKKRTTATEAEPASEKPKKMEMRPIPTSYETATPEDRMLLRMKDEEGKGWMEIREAWEAMTGDKVGASTLSGRYARIKTNFVIFKKEDEERLLKFKKEIERKFENEKWHRVAEAIKASGGGKYPAAAVQRRFKELHKAISATKADNEVGIDAS